MQEVQCQSRSLPNNAMKYNTKHMQCRSQRVSKTKTYFVRVNVVSRNHSNGTRYYILCHLARPVILTNFLMEIAHNPTLPAPWNPFSNS